MHIYWYNHDEEHSRSNTKNRGSSKVNDVKSEETNNKYAKSDLYHALFPIYHLSKICGLFPVRFTKEANGRYKGRLHTLDIVYSVCLLMIIIGAEFWGLWRDIKDGWENSTRLKSSMAIIPICSDILGVFAVATIAVLGAPFRWKHLYVVQNKLTEVDEILGIVSPKKTRRFTIVLSVCTLLYLLIVSTLDFYWWYCDSKNSKKMNDKGAINYLPLYIMYLLIVMMEIHYGLIAYNLNQRFVRLNKSLENILKRDKMTEHFRKDLGLAGDIKNRRQLTTYAKQELESERTSKTSERYPTAFVTTNFTSSITQLITVHSYLCDTVSSINSAFGLAVLIITLTCILHLVITPYFLILEANGTRQWLYLVVQTLWCVLHTSRMFIIIQPTHAITVQAKRTAVLVSQLLSSNVDGERKKQLEIFSLQLLHRQLDFTACGLFSVDRTLVTSIAGTVTTYLVILIQFQNEGHAKDDVDNIIKNATQILKNASTLQNWTALKPHI